MIDKNLDYKVTVHTTATVKGYFKDAAKKTGLFESEIGHRCFIRCIKLDTAPAWKQFIVKLIGL